MSAPAHIFIESGSEIFLASGTSKDKFYGTISLELKSDLFRPVQGRFKGTVGDLKKSHEVRLRERIIAFLRELFPPIIENWLSSIILGDLRGISKDLIDSFRATGLLHLLVVSGLHIGFFAIAALFIFALPFRVLYAIGLLPAGAWVKTYCVCMIISIVAVVAFSFFIGFKPPAQRAALLAVVATLSSFATTQNKAPAIFLRAITLQAFIFPVNFMSLSNLLTWTVYSVIANVAKNKAHPPIVNIMRTQALLLVVLAGTIGDVATIGLFCNLIFVKVFTAVFLSTFLLLFSTLVSSVLTEVICGLHLVFIKSVFLTGAFALGNPWLFFHLNQEYWLIRVSFILFAGWLVLTNRTFLWIANGGRDPT
tara:strand:- start:860 stop:1957 length:1098 start_codon:yes stop_codon:yes gene_type:complete